jgi:hypothetical protein
MSTAFNYRPKYVDIRVCKPDADETPRAPQERACDHVGCAGAGAHRAPKSKDPSAGFWWFCQEHAGEYNRKWNYFEGMTDEELAAYDAAEAAGHRPTWTFKAGSRDRLFSAARGAHRGPRTFDPFAMFNAARERREERRISRLQRLALDALGLEETAAPDAVRARYADLVKRYHPDSNGGDRTREAELNKVIRAYQVLKAAGLG